MIEHTVKGFDADLNEIERSLSKMGDLAQRQIIDAIKALTERDVKLAHDVKASDEAIDALQRSIETSAIATIARRQPMAVDLREIVGALRIANDLERVGDLAVNIAKRVEALPYETWAYETGVGLSQMARLAIEQLRRAIDSYTRRDLVEALEVWNNDKEIDALNDLVFRQLLTYMMEDPHNIGFGTHLIFCAKNIERIGDHATNIAESIHYIVQGKSILGERPKTDALNLQIVN